MTKRVTYTLVLTAIAAGLIALWSCGDLDPAKAPTTAVVQFVVAEAGEIINVEISVDEDLEVALPCKDVFRDALVSQCQTDPRETSCLPSGLQDDDLNTLLTTGSVTSDGTDYSLTTVLACCENYGWDELPDRTKDAIRASLLRPGTCGYSEIILAAVVFKSSAGAVGDISSTVGFDTFNDVEVRWTTFGSNMELYELADIPGEIAPLGQPFLDRTNGRGISELKIRWPLPITPGATVSYVVRVDIGYSLDEYEVEYVVDDLTEETADIPTDDDATGF